jgi:tubulin monoglycylase TTLL3/8
MQDDEDPETDTFGLLEDHGYQEFDPQGREQVVTNNGNSVIMGVKGATAAANQKQQVEEQSQKKKTLKKKIKKKVAPPQQMEGDEYSDEDEEQEFSEQAEEQAGPPDDTINLRHKEWLLKLAEEKRMQRETEEEAVKKQEERRMKKKALLVKKANQRRGEAGFAATTKLSQTKTIVKKAKKELTAEEQAAADKEKYELVKEERRKHKENYKKQLVEIKAKLKREKEEEEEKERKAEERKRRVKATAMKKLTQDKILVTTNVSSPPRNANLNSRDDGSGTASAKKLRPTKTKSPDLGAGSGLQAVRNRANSTAPGLIDADPKDAGKQGMTDEERKANNARILARQNAELVKLKEKRDAKKAKEDIKKKQLERREKLLKAKYNQVKEEKEEGEEKAEEETPAPETTKASGGPPPRNPKPKPSKPAKAIAEAKSMSKASSDPAADEDGTPPPGGAVVKGKNGKIVKVLSADEIATSAGRLSQRKKGDAKVVEARDFNDWKRKNGVGEDQKVFAMTGWYPCVKEELLERGWFFNEDRESPFFDLKWTLRSTDVKNNIQPFQLTNHFLKNTAITTKIGLMKSMRNLTWFAAETEDAIFPRGYDLKHPTELAMFMDDYRCLKAESLLKLILVKAHRHGFEVDTSEMDLGSLPPFDTDGSNFSVNARMLKALLNVCEKTSYKLEDEVIDDSQKPHASLVSDIESELILNGDKWLWSVIDINCEGGFNTEVVPPQIDQFLKDKEKAEKEKELLVTTTSTSGGIKKDPPTASQLRAYDARMLRKKLEHRKVVGEELGVAKEIKQADVDRILSVLTRLQNTVDPLQKTLDGSISNNLWIVKPAGKSRGRGIATFQDIGKILDYTDAKNSGNGEQWVVQKYMENPLTIASRKFDVRQWILVTDWNPLTIWFYDDCYCRFAVAKYDNPQKSLDKLEGSLAACLETDGIVKDKWLDDQYVHLVNNSITSKNKKFHKAYSAENGVEVVDNMWPAETFKEWIEHKTGENKWEETIKPRMKEIAKHAVMCAQDMVEHRKNSWELYGVDFMFDDNYMPWLIEINSSPACDYSTAVTESYVQRALPDILKVTLDFKGWEKKRAEGKAKKSAEPDTGGWKLIHKGADIPTPLSAFGRELGITGNTLKLPRGAGGGSKSKMTTGIPVAVGLEGIREMSEKKKDSARGTEANSDSEDDESVEAEFEGEAEESDDGEEGNFEQERRLKISEEKKRKKEVAKKAKEERRAVKKAAKEAAKAEGEEEEEKEEEVPAPDLTFDDSDLSDYEAEDKPEVTEGGRAEEAKLGQEGRGDEGVEALVGGIALTAKADAGAGAEVDVDVDVDAEGASKADAHPPSLEEMEKENAAEPTLFVDKSGRQIKGTKKFSQSTVEARKQSKMGLAEAGMSKTGGLKVSTLTFDL